VQRIRDVKSAYKDKDFGEIVPSAAVEQLTACADACPSQALTLGNVNEEASVPATTRKSGRSSELFADLNTFPAVNYLAKASFHKTLKHHGAENDHDDGAHAEPEHVEPVGG
jgi:Fe-S-cluster-containing dehydrogenase component